MIILIERYLIEHCSPTLASLKTANLINIPYESIDELNNSVAVLNSKLKSKGVVLLVLKYTEKSALIYTCRTAMLQEDLSKKNVREFLSTFGYENTDAQYCIARLKQRLCTSDEFPHEIGVFLGYPLGDVKGFIENAGQNSKCSGCWKVYCNECEAIKTFAKYKKCTQIYQKLWLQGRSITKLTVA